MTDIEQLKQKILDLAIKGKLVPQDPNDDPAYVLLEQIQKEKEQLVKEGKIKKSKDDSFIYKGSDNRYYEKTIRLQDALDYIQPGPFIVNSTNYDDSFDMPVLTAGKSFILGYTNETEGVYHVGNNPVIIFDDFTTSTHLVDFDFKVKSSAMKILKSKSNFDYDIHYLYYLLQTIKVNSDTHKRFWISDYQPLKVLMPPYWYQRKVSLLLDYVFEKFKLLQQEKKKITLIGENLKKKILAVYFGHSSDKSHYKSLKEIGEIVGGGTPRTDNKEFWNNGLIPWIGPADMGRFKEKYIVHITRKITEKGLNHSGAKLMPAGSVIMSSRAPIGYLGIATFPICTNQGCKSVVPNDMNDSEYIYYAIMSQIKNLQRNGNGTTFNEVSGKALGNVLIPWPSSEARVKIVNQVKTLFLMIDDLL